MPFANDIFVYHADANRRVGTGLDACGRFAHSESIRAHVALAYNAQTFRVVRNFVWAFEDAVLATDALVIQMADDTSDGILFVCENGTAIQACRIYAMVACSGDSLLIGRRGFLAQKKTDCTP